MDILFGMFGIIAFIAGDYMGAAICFFFAWIFKPRKNDR
jgi:hypothetical protein